MQVLGISYAHRGDPVEKTKEYREQTKLTYPVLVDAKNQSEPLFGVRVVPTNIVVGKDGVIRYKVSGLKQDGLIPAVEAALAAK